MADIKRYYWLRFQHDFFNSKRIKKLRNMKPDGASLVLIYLKMQLKSIETAGVIECYGIEPTIAEEIALDIDEEPESVGKTINYLLSCGLAEMIDENHMLLPFVVDNIGSETASAQRSREYRKSKVLQNCCNEVAMQQQCNNIVTESKSNSKSNSNIYPLPPLSIETPEEEELNFITQSVIEQSRERRRR